jgi:hypothetical protein
MRWIRAAIVGIGTVLAFPGVGFAQAAPSPSPAGGGVPIGNPGASVSGLPFSGNLHDLIMWATGIGFIACLGAFLSGAGVLRPLGHLFGHEKTAVRGTTTMIVSGVGAFFLASGFILLSFFWTVGGGMH